MVSVFTPTSTSKTIKQHQLIELTKKDMDSFVNASLNSASPTEQAINDAQWYQTFESK